MNYPTFLEELSDALETYSILLKERNEDIHLCWVLDGDTDYGAYPKIAQAVPAIARYRSFRDRLRMAINAVESQYPGDFITGLYVMFDESIDTALRRNLLRVRWLRRMADHITQQGENDD